MRFLRHEERPIHDPRFHTSLTLNGQDRSEGLQMEQVFSSIYASPFVRAMQTIAPLARRWGVRIKVEPLLAEGQHHELFEGESAYTWTAAEYAQFADVIDTTYEPKGSALRNVYPESDEDISARVERFLSFAPRDALVCTHECIIRTACKLRGAEGYRTVAMGKFIDLK